MIKWLLVVVVAIVVLSLASPFLSRYGLVLFVLSIVAAIPFGLGYLVLIPVIFASTYVAYRQIFTYETAAPTVLAPG